MVRVQFIEVGPGMDDVAFLGIVCTEEAVDGGIPSAFVAIAPKHDAGMVDVTFQHFADKPGARRSVVSILPACQFVNVEQAEGVAGIQKVCIGWIMGADGVHIHLLDKLHVLYAEFFICGSSAVRMERVAVDTFHHQFRTIQVKTVAGTEINGTEADTGVHGVNDISRFAEQGNREPVERRRFGSPGRDAVKMGGQQLDGVGGDLHRSVFGVLCRYR